MLSKKLELEMDKIMKKGVKIFKYIPKIAKGKNKIIATTINWFAAYSVPFKTIAGKAMARSATK